MGSAGGRPAQPTGGLLVVVDVLSFTTSVSVCVERGTQVYPAAWQDRRAGELAERVGAALATGRRAATPTTPGRSPPRRCARPPPPAARPASPNGSAIAAAAPPGVTVVAACLRNATAVGRRVARRGRWSPSSRRASAGPTVRCGPPSRTCWAPARSSPRRRRRTRAARCRPRRTPPAPPGRHARPGGRRPRLRLRPGTGARRVRRRRRDRRRARRERRGARAGRGRLQARRLMLITYAPGSMSRATGHLVLAWGSPPPGPQQCAPAAGPASVEG